MMFPIVVPNLQSQCPGITGVDHQIEFKHFKKNVFLITKASVSSLPT